MDLDTRPATEEKCKSKSRLKGCSFRKSVESRNSRALGSPSECVSMRLIRGHKSIIRCDVRTLKHLASALGKSELRSNSMGNNRQLPRPWRELYSPMANSTQQSDTKPGGVVVDVLPQSVVIPALTLRCESRNAQYLGRSNTLSRYSVWNSNDRVSD